MSVATATAVTDRRPHICSGDIIEHAGYRFRVTFERDDDIGAPWDEHDGHGIVSAWERRGKRPGERVLVTDGRGRGYGRARYYDVQGTITIATADGWGPPGGKRPDETDKQAIARAVDADFEYCHGWATDQWEWLYIRVEQVDDEDEPTGKEASLGGVESYAEYHQMVVWDELLPEVLGLIEVDEPDVQLSEN